MITVHHFNRDFKQYIPVAKVDTDSFGEAFQLTNNITHSWVLNRKVQTLISGDLRSTSVGDIYEENNVFYSIEPVGIQLIEDIDQFKATRPQYIDEHGRDLYGFKTL